MDWILEYSKAKDEFRINDGAGCYSDTYPVPGDGIALIKIEDEDEADEEPMVFLVALHSYAGSDFEPNTVYDLSATETEVAEDVDLSVEPADESEDEEDEE